MKRVMGIDQSYRKCGVVILSGIEPHCVQIISANPELDIYGQAKDVVEQISELINYYTPDLVGMEGLAFSSRGNRTRDLGGLLFVIHHQLRYLHSYEFKKNFFEIPPTTLKKFATGKGNNKKKMLYEALPESMKQHFKTMGYTSIAKGREDVTDAYWIARYLQENK